MSQRAARPRIRLIHWNAAEAKERAARLSAAGYQVAGGVPAPGLRRELRESPPAAVVIDLTRLPAAGRDVAVALRASPSTRQVPLVFVEGEPDKVARIRELMPDATFTTWRRIGGALKRALSSAPRDPVSFASVFAAYAGRPLTQKLGIRSGSTVGLLDAPEGFEQALGELPRGAVLKHDSRSPCDLVLWFTTSRRELERRIKKIGAGAGKDGLWVLWPKASSGLPTDLTQIVVRKVGLAAGLVDYKIAAVDATWSGLRFTRRKGFTSRAASSSGSP
jgi:hypothetical protein